MSGLTIKGYGDQQECQYFYDGRCTRYNRGCGEGHVDGLAEDGEE